MVKGEHGIEKCKDCRKIVLLILNPKNTSIRFNALLKLCRETIDPKYSPARLQRHLKGLEKMFPFLKRTEKGKQKVVYSINLPKENLDLAKLDFKETIENLAKMPLSKLINMKLRLYRLIVLEQTIASLEELSNKITPQEHVFKLVVLTHEADKQMIKLDQALINRTKSEYSEVLKRLKDERSAMSH